MIHIGAAIAIVTRVLVPADPFPAEYGGATLGRSIMVSIDGGKPYRSFAGRMLFRDRGGRWSSYCGDVRAPISSGQVIVMKPHSTTLLGGRHALAGNIVAKHFRKALNQDQCAGLQLAIWEAMEDGGAKPNFGNGRFQVGASAPVLHYAAQFYEAVNSPGEAVFLQAAPAGGGQSQFTPV